MSNHKDVDIGVYSLDTKWNTLMVHQRFAISPRASFAMELTKVLMCGEHEEGGGTYQKVCTVTPMDAVNKAMTTTELLFDQLEAKGWIVRSPDIQELIAGDQPNKAGF